MNTTALTEIVAPKKARPGQQSQPPGREVERGQDLTRNSEVLFRQTVDTYLTQNKIADAVRAAVRQMGTVGTAHFNLIEMAMTGWKATAYDQRDFRGRPGTAQCSPGAPEHHHRLLGGLRRQNRH